VRVIVHEIVLQLLQIDVVLWVGRIDFGVLAVLVGLSR
jgi:hypothetical protein